MVGACLRLRLLRGRRVGGCREEEGFGRSRVRLLELSSWSEGLIRGGRGLRGGR